MDLFKCKICGKDFKTRRYDYEKGRTITCSNECKIKYKIQKGLNKRAGIYSKCDLPGCNKEFYRRPWQNRRVIANTGYFFCCKEHQVRARYVLDDFKSGPEKTKLENVSEYRRKGLFFSGPRCEICGFCETVILLDVHHIDNNRLNSSKENLITLCLMCHGKVTRGLAKIEDRKFIAID